MKISIKLACVLITVTFYACFSELDPLIPTFEIIDDLTPPKSLWYVDAIETQDHLCVALSTITEGSSVYIQIEKRNRKGELEWGPKKIGNGVNDAFALSETADGELLIAGMEVNRGKLYKRDRNGEDIDVYSASEGSDASIFKDVDVAPNGDIFALAQIASAVVVFKLRSIKGGPLELINHYNVNLNGQLPYNGKFGLDASCAGRVTVACSTIKTGSSFKQGLLVQLDANTGAEILNHPYTDNNTFLYAAATLANGDAIGVGSSFVDNKSQIFVVKQCESGACNWEKTLPTSRSAYGFACSVLNDNQIAVLGKRFVDDSHTVAYFCKTSSQNNNDTSNDTKDFGGRSSLESETGNSIFFTSEGYFIMTSGIEPSPSPGYLFKTDEKGNIF